MYGSDPEKSAQEQGSLLIDELGNLDEKLMDLYVDNKIDTATDELIAGRHGTEYQRLTDAVQSATGADKEAAEKALKDFREEKQEAAREMLEESYSKLDGEALQAFLNQERSKVDTILQTSVDILESRNIDLSRDGLESKRTLEALYRQPKFVTRAEEDSDS